MVDISKAAPKPLPCPFCGSSLVSDCYVRGGRQMVCHGCGVSGPRTFHGPAGDTVERAVSAWNTRDIDVTKRDADKALIADLVAALDQCSDLFADIKGDFTDPRSQCRKGYELADAAIARAKEQQS